MGHDLRLLLERLQAEPAGGVEAPTMRRLCEEIGAECLFSADGEHLAIDGEVMRLPFDPDMDQTESVNDFVNGAREDDAEQFGVRIPDVSEDFWESPAPLYHATPEENVESIREEGLGERSRTRGLSNRGVGAAVYTSTAIEDLEEGSYGDAIFVIDTEAMKRDGYTPRVDVEPDVAESEWREALAHKLGDDMYSWEIEGGMSPNTIVVFGHIPPKYLELVEPGRRQNPVQAPVPIEETDNGVYVWLRTSGGSKLEAYRGEAGPTAYALAEDLANGEDVEAIAQRLLRKMSQPKEQRPIVERDVMVIQDLHVAPEERLRGVGRALAARVEDLARSEGIDEIWLYAAGAQDPVRFWRAIGFSIVAVRTVGVRTAVMRKRVKPGARPLRRPNPAFGPWLEQDAAAARREAVRCVGRLRGSCDNAALGLWQRLHRRGLPAAVARGTFTVGGQDRHHVWVDVEGTVVDPTAEQYNGAEPGVRFPRLVVGTYAELPRYRVHTLDREP